MSSMSTVSLASRRGHFSTLDELTGCIRASMLVPGLAGPLVSVPERRRGQSMMADSAVPPPGADSVSDSVSDSDVGRPPAASQAQQQRKKRRLFRRRAERENRAAAAELQGGEELTVASSTGGDGATELLVDAMVFEPLPYR